MKRSYKDKLEALMFSAKPMEPSSEFDASFKARLEKARQEKLEEGVFARVGRLTAGALRFAFAGVPAMPVAVGAVILVVAISAGIYTQAAKPSRIVSVSREGTITIKGERTTIKASDIASMSDETLVKTIEEGMGGIAQDKAFTEQIRNEINAMKNDLVASVRARPAAVRTTKDILKDVAERSMPLERLMPSLSPMPLTIAQAPGEQAPYGTTAVNPVGPFAGQRSIDPGKLAGFIGGKIRAGITPAAVTRISGVHGVGEFFAALRREGFINGRYVVAVDARRQWGYHLRPEALKRMAADALAAGDVALVIVTDDADGFANIMAAAGLAGPEAGVVTTIRPSDSATAGVLKAAVTEAGRRGIEDLGRISVAFADNDENMPAIEAHLRQAKLGAVNIVIARPEAADAPLNAGLYDLVVRAVTSRPAVTAIGCRAATVGFLKEVQGTIGAAAYCVALEGDIKGAIDREVQGILAAMKGV